MLIFAQQPVCAQSNIDTNRMSRDINIMENVLEEMFKTSWAAHGNTVRVSSGSFSFGRSEDIRGTYLRDFGIIFTIPGGPPAFVMMSDSDGDKSSYSFRYDDSEEGEPVTEESITNRMVEFLQDYGSTIGQLSDDDKVMVIYLSHSPNRSVTIFHSRGDEKEKTSRQQLPKISAVATKGDLQAYRSGDISSDEFRSRLDISTADAGKDQKDLRVMAGIFETAFDEMDEKSFRIRGSVDYLHLDNFGALFSFNARYSDRGSWVFSEVAKTLEAVGEELEKTRADLENRIRSNIDSARSEKREKIEQSQKEQKQEVVDAYEQFLGDLKEYVVDYGRTLSSIDSNQRILVSVSLSSGYDEIPERIDLQIQKSVLESLDQGSMSRNQAMEQIQVREY